MTTETADKLDRDHPLYLWRATCKACGRVATLAAKNEDIASLQDSFTCRECGSVSQKFEGGTERVHRSEMRDNRFPFKN
jgi:hypothetical protein